jgi:Ca-activated chloride channel family protein
MSARLLAVTILALSGLSATDPRRAAPATPGVLFQADQPTFTARAELVVLHVMVKDRKGSYVTGLTSDAFRVLEDGVPGTIQFFGVEDAPATVGIVIDSSGSMGTLRSRVIAAAGAFAETSNPEDEIFALAFNDVVRPALPRATPFTRDPVTLRYALTSTISAAGRTALYDAITAGLDYVARGTYQTRALVVVSDGGDNASTATFNQVLRATQVSNTVIYTVALTDPLERDANPKLLRRLADASGGEAFRPRDITEVEEVLRRIARDLRNTYTIGYAPPDASGDGRFHRVRVEVAAPGRGGLRVRTRDGYIVEQ